MRRSRHCYFVARLEHRLKRNEFAVDLGANTMDTNICVHRESKVQRRRPERQMFQFAVRREDKHLVMEKIDLEEFHELFSIRHILLPIEHLAKPRKLPVRFLQHMLAFFVQPMCRDSVLRDVMHGRRPNLDFHHPPIWSDHGRMQRLIHILFRRCDIVVESVSDRCPHVVNHTQRVIAILNCRRHYANCDQIVDLFKRFLPLNHLAIDRIKMLGASCDLNLHSIISKSLGQHLAQIFDIDFTFGTRQIDSFHQITVDVRLDVLQRQVFQFPFDLRHSESMRQRRINIARFGCNDDLLLVRQVFQRAHIVQPVGEFDQDHANIIRHRNQHFAEIISLVFGPAFHLIMPELGHAVYESSDFRRKLARQLVNADVAVFYDIVQQPGCYGIAVQMLFRQNVRYVQAVLDVRLAGSALLPLVRPVGKLVRFAHHRYADVCIHRLDVNDELGKIHHAYR